MHVKYKTEKVDKKNLKFISRYSPVRSGVYEIAGPYLLRASEKYEPYSTSAIARVEYGSYFSLARNKYEGITNECDSTNWLCQLSQSHHSAEGCI